jgi:hypothetical protein
MRYIEYRRHGWGRLAGGSVKDAKKRGTWNSWPNIRIPEKKRSSLGKISRCCGVVDVDHVGSSLGDQIGSGRCESLAYR